MKKIQKSKSKKYLPVVLHLEDLKEIEEILLESSANKSNIEISDENFVYNSVDELLNKRSDETLSSLDFKLSDPYIVIEFSKIESSIYVSGRDENQSIVLFYRLDSLLQKKVRMLGFAYSFKFLFACNFFIILSGFFNLNPILKLLLMISSLFWLVWFVIINLTRHSLIVLRSRKIAGFWRKNKDTIVVGLICALAGASVQPLIDFLSRSLNDKVIVDNKNLNVDK